MSQDKNIKPHISSYKSHAIVLVILLFLTAITVLVASIDFGFLTIAVTLGIASTKAILVLSYFMHLKYESRFTRSMVFGIFVLFALVVVLMFFDYSFR